ncbi:hypothetical protein [[Eubacterium] hominis]|uniref:hypothetical protein n=1 Tax=[Eubacterium] hominis TaxID=2764325 RepID=UPI0023DD9A35
MKSANEFAKERIGKGVDVDGYYGAQCWDLFAYFCQQAGYKVINCTTSLFVKDIWNNRKTNGALTNFTEVSVKNMQDGDWVIWGDCDVAPTSHIGMFRRYTGNNRAIILGQNQLGVQKATEVDMTLNGVIGVLRPNCYKNKCPFKSSGAVKPLYNGIRVRTAPSTKKGDTGIVYNADSPNLYYNRIVLADGWYWAEYDRAKGRKGYCALCKADGSSKYWKQV